MNVGNNPPRADISVATAAPLPSSALQAPLRWGFLLTNDRTAPSLNPCLRSIAFAATSDAVERAPEVLKSPSSEPRHGGGTGGRGPLTLGLGWGESPGSIKITQPYLLGSSAKFAGAALARRPSCREHRYASARYATLVCAESVMPLPFEQEALCRRLEMGQPEPSAAALIRQQARDIDELWDRLSRAYLAVRREMPGEELRREIEQLCAQAGTAADNRVTLESSRRQSRLPFFVRWSGLLLPHRGESAARLGGGSARSRSVAGNAGSGRMGVFWGIPYLLEEKSCC